MAQVISRLPLTVEAWVYTLISPCGTSAGQRGTETGFALSSSVFHCQHHSIMALHVHISLGDEQEGHWWLQFKDIVSSHQHKQQHGAPVKQSAWPPFADHIQPFVDEFLSHPPSFLNPCNNSWQKIVF
jgi:hypothetical protein